MKHLAFIISFLFFAQLTYSQEIVENKQLMIGIANVQQNTIVEHTTASVGTYWEYDDGWVISSDPDGEGSAIITIGNSDFDHKGWWDGWNWFWKDTTPENRPWALGFYKVTNNIINGNSYFYIDCRVDEFGNPSGQSPYNPPDFWVYFNNSNSKYYYNNGSGSWNEISYAQVVRIWEIHGTSAPTSNSLPNYWDNVLLRIDGGGDNPRMTWGPHSSFNTTNFYIYRAVSTIPVNPKNLTFSLIAIRNASTYEFTDPELEINGQESNYAYYYVKAYNSSSQTFSSSSNIISVSGEYNPHKKSDKFISYETVQSIDFDDSGGTVFGLSRWGETASIVRYYDGNWEEWNLTNLFYHYFSFVITTIDKEGNYLALLNDTLYKFDRINWTAIPLPNIIGAVRYAHITEDKYNNIWVSIFDLGYGSTLFKITDTEVTDYTSYFPEHPNIGEVYAEGDSIWICSTLGLALLYNDQLKLYDSTNSAIPTKWVYSFHKGSNGQRWIGSADKGLIKWVNDSSFVLYNNGNTGLTNNFVNAISEDSQGNIWFATDEDFASLSGDEVTIYPFYNYSVVALEVDPNDNIWLGTIYDGLYYFDRSEFLHITSVSEEIEPPDEYLLSQNYPNPFNPSTTIRFQIPERSSVTLKVYDVLGNEITTLVDEVKPSGTYEVEFNAKVLSSGVYIFRLTSGSFTASKKLILLK